MQEETEQNSQSYPLKVGNGVQLSLEFTNRPMVLTLGKEAAWPGRPLPGFRRLSRDSRISVETRVQDPPHWMTGAGHGELVELRKDAREPPRS